MSEGELIPNYTQYPNWDYTQGEFKYGTRKGIKFMFFALIVGIIEIIYTMISYPLRISLISDITSQNVFEITWFLTILSGISFILLLVFVVLVIISLYFFNQGRYEFNQQHEENIKWAKIFLITYLILFLITFILAFIPFIFTYESFLIFISIYQAIGILQTFLLAFSILLLVRGIASDREKDILYITTSLMIIIPILRTIVELAVPSAVQYTGSLGSIIYVEVFSLISLMLWAFIAFAYYNIFTSFDVYSRYLPLKTSKFLPRPQPIANYGDQFYSRPILAFILLLIIAIVLGASTGLSYRALFSSDSDVELPFTIEQEPFYLDGTREGEETIQEGQSITMEISVDGAIIYLEGLLVWSDEPDQGRYTNQPDWFTVEVEYGNDTLTFTESNPHGGEGRINFDQGFIDDELDTLIIIITLSNAGDQTGPLRRWSFIPDNSNDIYFEFYYEYIEESNL